MAISTSMRGSVQSAATRCARLSYVAHQHPQQPMISASAVPSMRKVQQPRQQEEQQDPLQYQAVLAARVEQINLAITQLQPRSAALRDPQTRKEVEQHLRDLKRHGLFASEAFKDLNAILLERGRAWEGRD